MNDEVSIQRVERALEEIRRGRMVILVDDEDRENEGDLVMSADWITPEAVNFMAKYGRGLICLSLTAERCKQLDLDLMVKDNGSGFGTAFTISIEAAQGVSTGISAADRAHTIRTAVTPNARPQDLVRPGHIFPLKAAKGGVLVRTGQTEGSVDLSRLAGREPAGVICEIMNDDGTMARRPQLEVFAKEHGLMILSVADLIQYRLMRERLVQRRSEAEVQIGSIGVFKAISYTTVVDDLEHLILVKGQPSAKVPTIGRVHQESIMGDIFRTNQSESRWKLEFALRQMEEAGCGVLVYLQKTAPKVSTELDMLSGRSAPTPQIDKGSIGLPSDLREFGIGAQILLDQGVRQLRVVSNQSSRIRGLEGYGLSVVDQIKIPPRPKDTPSALNPSISPSAST
jgi:3,4-dihydroxy 2-butanone 4-phosphate synthase / GTP cyclohydrolase II